MKEERAESIRMDLYMAGDIALARQVCREYCYRVGLCVHIEAVEFVYTGGSEAGFKVGLINYPRFPATVTALEETARSLAGVLMERLCQDSFSVVGPHETIWVSRKDDHR